jgi:2-dehydropantoate 2-reductase
MRILVLGAGGTGGYFGGRLLEAGADVSFLVRPARAQRLAADGLRIVSPCGDFSSPVKILTAPDAVAPFDLILLSCKAYDLDSAIAAIRPAVGANTRILPLLNGLKHFDLLDAAFGSGQVIGGLCHISVTLGVDGEVQHLNKLHRLTFGNRAAADKSLTMITALLSSINAEVRVSEQIITELWEKFVFLASLAGTTCLMRASIGEIAATADGAAFARKLLQTCAEVARRSGMAPRERSLQEAETALTAINSTLKASMLRDIERSGPTEGEHILGDMLARARQYEIPSEVLALARCHVQAYESRRG